jgi:hypothetical protein
MLLHDKNIQQKEMLMVTMITNRLLISVQIAFWGIYVDDVAFVGQWPRVGVIQQKACDTKHEMGGWIINELDMCKSQGKYAC